MNLPTDLQGEQAVIGACIMGGMDACQEACERIGAHLFFHSELQQAFLVIKAMVDSDREVDFISFKDQWAKQCDKPIPQAVSESLQHGVSGVLLDHHIKGLTETYKRRKTAIALQSALARIQQSDSAAVISSLESDLMDISGDRGTSNVGVKEACAAMIDDLERRVQNKGGLNGVPTGFVDLDKKLSGLQYGEQTLIAARPSAGKTAMGLNILHHACLIHKIPTLFVSLEMSIPSLMRRLLSGWGNITMNKLRDGDLEERQAKRFPAFQGLLLKSPMHCIDGISGMNIGHLCACVRRNVRIHGIKLVIIDYLQKIQACEKHEKRTYEVGEVSGQLKALAVSTGCALLTLAQLNRESVRDKTPRPPRLSDLADSGQIERDADTVMMIHRDFTKPHNAVVIIGKQRDGEVGAVDLHFEGQFCRFETLSKIDQESVPDNRQYPT